MKKGLQWRTGEEHVRTYLLVGDNNGKLLLIPHNAEERKGNHQKRGLRLISLLEEVKAPQGNDQ